MALRAIHQLTAGFTGYDAISNEARRLRHLFQSLGYASEIFSDVRHIPPELAGQARDVRDGAESFSPDDIALLHLSVGSIVNDAFARLKCRKILLYHNITPGCYFAGVNPELATDLERGRDDARRLNGKADLVLADSGFNARELEAMGYHGVRVFPLLLDLDHVLAPIDPAAVIEYHDDLPTVLFVGRGAPNKRIEDCLEAFRLFQFTYASASRFLHVGSFAGARLYQALCQARARELQLRETHFLGSIPQTALNAVYQRADLFLCLSDHEGFCIPLLEAMTHGIPVIAYAAGAVEETLDGAGVLLRDKDPGLVAAVMARVLRDPEVRTAVRTEQRQRIDRYRCRDLGAELHGLIRDHFG